MVRKKVIFSFMVILGMVFLPFSVNAASVEMTYCKISPLSWTRTYSINKRSWDGQKIKMRNAYTPITEPCPNCEFDFELHNEATGKTEGRLRLKMNQTGSFPGDTDMPPGRYYLKIKRVGITTVPSTVSFTWTY